MQHQMRKCTDHYWPFLDFSYFNLEIPEYPFPLELDCTNGFSILQSLYLQ